MNINYLLKIFRTLLLCAAIFLISSCVKEYDENYVAGKFVSPDNRYDLYKLIEKYSKDKRIIILGECGHGDGRTFEIKSEIVRYLDSIGDYTLILEGMNPFDGAILNEELPVLIINTSWLNVGSSWNSLWSQTEEASKLVKGDVNTKEALLEVCADETVMEALFIASPSFYREVQKWREGKLPKNKNWRHFLM